MTDQQLIELLNNLIKQPHENEWVEFKLNFHSPEEIGERISALSNGACIQGQSFGYLVFGVEDKTHIVKGTSFQAKSHKKGNKELEHWLANRLNPRIDFSIFVIPATKNRPVEFLHQAYIRIGSITRKLNDFPEKQAKIWKKDTIPFEKEIAKDNLNAVDITKYLSTETYFDLIKLPYPSTQQGVIEKFIEENLVVKNKGYAITKLGALLFAKNLKNFESVERKSVRVIVYKGKNKVETEREQIGLKGYALGFVGLIDWINSQLPANEEIGKALRKDTRMYPEIAVRELVAKALIHQDFTVKGFPMIEISNSGTPCLDKVIFYNELYQLPPINVIVTENRTHVSIYSYKTLNNLDKKEKIRACYQHACLKYVSNEKMTNQSLRERFKIENKNAAIASRIIRDALKDGVIKEDDPESKSRKYAGYLPIWA